MLEEMDSLWYKVLSTIYGEEEGRICTSRDSGLVWWQNIIGIREGVGVGVGNWLTDNSKPTVGSGTTTLFWKDWWVGESRLCDRCIRFFDLAENKLSTVVDNFFLGGGEDGDA